LFSNITSLQESANEGDKGQNLFCSKSVVGKLHGTVFLGFSYCSRYPTKREPFGPSGDRDQHGRHNSLQLHWWQVDLPEGLSQKSIFTRGQVEYEPSKVILISNGATASVYKPSSAVNEASPSRKCHHERGRRRPLSIVLVKSYQAHMKRLSCT